MTFRKAKEIYGIDYLVLYRRVKNPNIKTQGGQTALTAAEEKLLVSSILICAKLDWIDLM